MAEELFSVLGPASRPALGEDPLLAVELACYVQPRAGRAGIVGRRHGALHLRVAQPPENGRANRAVESLVGELFGVGPSAVRVVAGERSRHKRVQIDGVTLAGVHRALAQAGGSDPARPGAPRGSIRGSH